MAPQQAWSGISFDDAAVEWLAKNTTELEILAVLDRAVASKKARTTIDAIAARLERRLREPPTDALVWASIPLDVYDERLPGEIRSSWVFILRANATTGAERHPNSIQRMTSYRGSGDFQTRPADEWLSHQLRSDPNAPLASRWISIPRNEWHQGVVSSEDWVVVSFHTVAANALIEERPSPEADGRFDRRRYVARPASS